MASTWPQVSVIVVVKDGAATIGSQLEALGRQRGAPSFEVVVVDNGSTDDTAAVVRTWLGAGAGSACEARLVDASAKPGIPFARNTGAKASRGDVLAFCDADDVVSDDWLQSLVRGLAGHGIVGGRTEAYESDGTPRPDASINGPTFTRFLPYVPTCNMAVHRNVLFDVGGFDESLPRYGFEDVDFAWRVQLAGHSLGFVPEAVIRFSVSGRTTSVRKVWSLAKGRMAMVQRHPEFRAVDYSFKRCVRESISLTMTTPRRLIRSQRRSRELRELVASYGRLHGYWHYVVRGKDEQAVRIGPDPRASRGVEPGSA